MKTNVRQAEVDVARVYPGPILVLAGPGTGKTHQLARRVKWLVEDKDVSPEEITVITFTSEAARNMRERLLDETRKDVYLTPDMQPQHIRTMHSLGQLIIAGKYRKVGLRKGFRVVTGELRNVLLEDSARLLGFAGRDASLAEECRRKGKCTRADDVKCRICAKYQELLRKLNAIDYDDQIFLACALLRQLPDLLSEWRKATKYLLVDEYQDINQAQYELIRLLSDGQEEGLFVVGDDDQSIYSWRGGSPDFITNFETHFGRNAQKYPLRDCWRCPREVLEPALALVARNNPKRFPKELRSKREGRFRKPVVWDVPSDKYEADRVCSLIAEMAANQDVLVLVPAHRFAIPVKRAMRRRRIGYDCKTTATDTGLKRIHDLILWLRNEKDDFALRLCVERIISNRDMKIPPDRLQSIAEQRENTRRKISKVWPIAIANKTSLYTSMVKELSGERDVKKILDLLGEIKTCWEGTDAAGFIESAARIIRPWPSSKSMADEIEEWVQDALARDAGSGSTLARILTMESAKGLGMDAVFVLALNKGIFPPEGASDDQLLEKQRLMYVSMTRAKKELHLFSARTRAGQFSFQPSMKDGERSLLERSPFLEWLPTELVEFEEKWRE